MRRRRSLWLGRGTLEIFGLYLLTFVAEHLPWEQVAVMGAPLRFLLVSAYAFFGGCWRATAFSPTARSGYVDWLTTTPWRAGRPLPFGPATLVWRDAAAVVVLGLMLAAGIGLRSVEIPAIDNGDFDPAFLRGALDVTGWVAGTVHPWAGLTVFGVIWCGTFFLVGHAWLATTQLKHEPWLRRLGLALLPFAAFPRFEVLQMLAVLAAVTVVNQIGQRRQLRRLPYERVGLGRDWADWSKRQATAVVGTAFGRVGPDTSEPEPVAALIVNRAVLAWWLTAVFDVIHREADGAATAGRVLAGDWFDAEGNRMVLIVWGVIAAGMLIARLARYRAGYGPPISLWGRVRSLRPILPGYDQVWVVPFLIVVFAILGPRLLASAGLPMGAVLGGSVFTLTVLGRLGPPSIDTWRHTGRHRVTPPPPAEKPGDDDED